MSAYLMIHHITRLFTTGHTYLVWRLRRLAMQRGEQYLSQVSSSHRTRTRPRPLVSRPVTSFRTALLDISAPKPKPRGANIGVRPGILGVTSTVERGASSCIKRDMNVCSLRCHPTRMINTQTQPLTVRNNSQGLPKHPSRGWYLAQLRCRTATVYSSDNDRVQYSYTAHMPDLSARM